MPTDEISAVLAQALDLLEARLSTVLGRAERGAVAAAGDCASIAFLRERIARELRLCGYADPRRTTDVTNHTARLEALRVANPAFARADDFAGPREPAFQLQRWALTQRDAFRVFGFSPEATDILWRGMAFAQMGAGDAWLVDQFTPHVPNDLSVWAVVGSAQRLLNQLNLTVGYASDTGRVEAFPSLYYVYGGPVDGRVRPFCLAHVGRVYTRAEIDGLNNAELPNAYLTGGGWDCRHLWQPLSEFDPLVDLHGSSTREPSVAAALARL